MGREPSPPDVELATAERVAAIREWLIGQVREAFGYIPAIVEHAINQAAWRFVREGEHHAGLRNTVRKTPPDADRVNDRRAPDRRAPWDNEATPVYGVRDHKKDRR